MADTDAYGRSGSGWAERDKDEEDIAAQREWSATKDATVFLIDCSPSMALPVQTTRSEDDSSPSQPPSRGIDLALLLVETALRNAIVSNDSDFFAVVLFNTRESHNALSFDNVVSLDTPATNTIDVPTARRIQQLRNLAATFDQDVGFGDSAKVEAALAHGLWVTSDLIQSVLRGKVLVASTKRVMLFTNNMTPLCGGSDGSTAIERSRLLQQTGIYVHVVPLASSPPGSTFYKRIHNDPDVPWDDKFESRLAALQERVRQRIHKKRRLTSLEMYISPGGAPVGMPGCLDAAPVRMAVGLYSLYMKATKPSAVRVDRATNVPLKTVSTFTAKGQALTYNARDHNTRVVRRLPYGGGDAGSEGALDFTPAEAAELRAGPGQPGIAVLGFKPLDDGLRDDDQMRASWFLYPEESLRPGSAVAFTALLGAMLKSRTMAVALLTRSAKAVPRLVALVPQAPEYETTSAHDGGSRRVAITHPGMHVLQLPYRDDIRLGIDAAVLPYMTAPPPDEEAAAAAKDVLSGVNLETFLLSETLPNPSLQHFHAKLEELGIDAYDVVTDAVAPPPQHEYTVDGTLPQVSCFPRAHLARFSAALGGLEPDAPRCGDGGGAKTTGVKRKAPDDADACAAAEVLAKSQAGQLAGATVDQLKSYCRANGLTLGGKKADLVQRVADHLAGPGAGGQ